MEGKLIERAHRQAVHASSSEIAGCLTELLSRRLVAYIEGVKDTSTVTRWASGEVERVRDENERRLRAAYEIAQLLVWFDSPKVVRAWFIGMNPRLDDLSPAEALHEGRLREAMAAAREFVAGG